MAKRRKVAVLGPIPHDRITTHSGETFEKYGCVLYTVVALSALMDPEDLICPIVHVRREDEKPIKDLLSDLPNVDLSGITSTADRGDIVELTYTDQNARNERQSDYMAPILPADVEPVLDADAFICVPITDYQVGIATLSYIRQNSNGLILLDGHGPTSTLTRSGERYNRLWLERDTWLPYIDVLKMNREEVSCSWFPVGEGTSRPVIGEPLSPDDLYAFADHCLEGGLRSVCITLDDEGCVVFHRENSTTTQRDYVSCVSVDEVVDTTGCGDSFAAGMGFGYLAYGDTITACRFGNAMGAQRCVGSELSIYRQLEDTLEQIQQAYGDVPQAA